jgi:hypothetical protein
MELEEVLRRRRMSQPRMPMDERLPDGRSVAELMAAMPALAGTSQPVPVTPPPNADSLGPPPPPPTFVPRGTPAPTTGPPIPVPARMGVEVPRNSSRLQDLLARHTALSQADPGSPVRRRDWGYEELPPEQSPSRLRHAGTGAAHGAMIAGQATKGDPWGTLAGAAVGALTGGVSPALMQAFMRRQELDQSTGDLAAEQGLQLRNAQIGETVAQTEQRRLEPYLKAEELRAQNERFEATERGRSERATAAETGRSARAAETNAMRKRRLEEQERHNKAVENKPGSATEEITVAGRKFKVSPSTAARILEARSTGANKVRVESGIEADLETEAANDHLAKRKAAENSASTLRAERDQLTAGTNARRNEARVKELDRQIAQEETEARYRQKEADDAFTRARKAKAKEASQPSQAGSTGGSKAFDLGRWKRDHPGADPSAVIQRAKDAGMRVIE